MNIFIPLLKASKVMNLGQEIAQGLLKIEAVKVNVRDPFTWTSGLRSPVYCDNRVTLSYPPLRSQIIDGFVALIKKEYPNVESISGIATAGIAQGALIADQLELPYSYVRPEPKKHGMKNQIEGKLEKGSKVILIEDLISTGLSSLKAVKACREYGVEVLAVLSIFTYGFDVSRQAFIEADCNVHSLCNFDVLNAEAVNMNYIKETDVESIQSWQKDPKAWSDLQSS